jgi:hypothetical protein
MDMCSALKDDKEDYDGYPGGYCTVPVGTAAVPVLWVLQMGTAGYCGYCGCICRVLWVLWMHLGTAQYPWVLQGTVGTVIVGYCGYCRLVLMQGTAERTEC